MWLFLSQIAYTFLLLVFDYTSDITSFYINNAEADYDRYQKDHYCKL